MKKPFHMGLLVILLTVICLTALFTVRLWMPAAPSGYLANTSVPEKAFLVELASESYLEKEQQEPQNKQQVPGQDYEELVIKLKADIDQEPGQAEPYYRLGLLYAAIEPELALAYLQQAARMDSRYTTNSRRMQDVIVTARLRGEPAYTFVETGRVLAALGEWELAGKAFKEATLSRPDYAEAWAFLGEAYQQTTPTGLMATEANSAVYALRRALSLDPRSVAANTFMGLYWKRNGRLDIAIAYLAVAVEVDPRNPALYTEMGSCTAETGDLPTAQAYYVLATELAPQDPKYWRLLAEFTLAHQGQVRETGLPAARQAVILAPTDPSSLNILGAVLYFLGDLDNAERFLIRSLEQDPDFAPAHFHLGLTYLMQGRAEESIRHLNLVIDLDPESAIAEQAQRITRQYFPVH